MRIPLCGMSKGAQDTAPASIHRLVQPFSNCSMSHYLRAKLAIMNVSQSGMSAKGGSGVFRPCRQTISSYTLKFCSFVFLFSSLSIGVLAQQTTPGLSPQDTSSSGDCSDPAMANSPSCSSQNGSPLSQPGNLQLGTQSSEQNAQPRVPESYTDTENLSRQGYGRGQIQGQGLLPPEPLTEFQKFVASATGQVLPIFGASLFRNSPSTFAPLDMTPVPSNYIIGPGDELRIRVWGQVSFQSNLRVDRSGEVFLPHVGPVHVAGLPFSGLDGQLRAAIGRVYRNFDLTVDVGQIRAIQVYVAGQARRPGVYTVSSLSTLVDALFASGGPSAQGTLRHIELRRSGSLVTEIDLYELLTKGDKSKDVHLASGDIIFIPPVGPQVAVTGSVRNPAVYELRPNESLGDVLSDCGGTSAVASDARVSIDRIEEHQDRHSMEVAYDKQGLSTALADGDLIHVFSIVPAFRKTVTLRGNLANPGRFAWHPGMHVSELIPDKESLITRNYWWKRAQLGLPAPEFEPVLGAMNLRQPTEPTSLQTEYQRYQMLQYRQWQQSQLGVQQPQAANQQNSGNAQQGMDPSLYGSYGGQGNPAYQQLPYPYPYPYSAPQNPLDLQSDQSEYAQDHFPLPGMQEQQGSKTTSSSLAAQQAARFKAAPGSVQKNEVRILAPEIDWDYASIERLDPDTLKTTVIPFDLGKLVLQHDTSQDMELQAGDVVTVFSEADIRLPLAQQTKLVKLEGEFAHSGTYSVHPGETLRQLIARAGGLTPNAYLFGSEFTRESTRVVQQARIDEYVQNLQAEMQRGTLATAAMATSSAQDISSATAAQATERELVARLRQIRATGRIVFQFDPTATGMNAIPDVPLEDGDRFIVPSVPSNVNVVGSVYNQNSFLFNKSERVGTYLRLAGGPNRSADSKHSFVIRADGEVVSRGSVHSAWGNEFNNLRLNPGDTVVVPEKVFAPSSMRYLLQWSQVFSQLAFGALAFNALP